MRTWSGFIYVAFVTDAYSRRIVGWQASKSLRAPQRRHRHMLGQFRCQVPVSSPGRRDAA